MKKYLLIILIICLSNAHAQDLDDLFFGTDSSFEILTWNIEWFPKNGVVTVDYVTQIIQALDVDILAIQELDDTVLFDQMLYTLPNYDGYYESLWFAGLAYIYKTETIVINDIYEIYTTSEYWSPFPRSPMVMDMDYMGENYIIINNHYKCCGDGYLNQDNPNDEETRRYIANNLLREYIEIYFPSNNVLIVGDLNDILTDDDDDNVFLPFLQEPEFYQFVDMDIAQGSSSGWSYPSWPSHIDHILITDELFDEFNGLNSEVITIPIDEYMDGGFYEYDQNISDHRPVAWKFYINMDLPGDVNADGIVNILDIIIVVNIILSSEYNGIADINNDSVIDILDVILIVNIIIN